MSEAKISAWKLSLASKVNSTVDNEIQADDVEFINNDDGWSLQCFFCERIFQVALNDGKFIPSNFYSHLRAEHRRMDEQIANSQASSTSIVLNDETSSDDEQEDQGNKKKSLPPKGSKRTFTRDETYKSVREKKITRKNKSQ